MRESRTAQLADTAIREMAELPDEFDFAKGVLKQRDAIVAGSGPFVSGAQPAAAVDQRTKAATGNVYHQPSLCRHARVLTPLRNGRSWITLSFDSHITRGIANFGKRVVSGEVIPHTDGLGGHAYPIQRSCKANALGADKG